VNGNDDMKEPSSPVCSANEADAAFMGYASREEIVAFLNVLLEAERAGARVTLVTSIKTAERGIRALAIALYRDETRWCSMLQDWVNRLDGVPSLHVGAFYDMAMAIGELPARLAFLNKGQEWVVRQLRETLPKVKEEALYRDLNEMLKAHERNIEKVASSGLANSR
jgi:hypothetical protein